MIVVRTVFAHGGGAQANLPLPVWLIAYGLAFEMLIAAVVLRIIWPAPRLSRVAAGAALPRGVQIACRYLALAARVLGLVAFMVVLVAASWGTDSAATNIAPIAVFVLFWQGMQVLSVAVGDVWRALDPFDTLAWMAGIPPGRTTGRGGAAPAWTAAAMLFSFVWVELAFYDPSSPRALAVWLGSYSVAALLGAAVWGRTWLREGEGFAALFGLLAGLAPFFRDETGKVRVRLPVTGLAANPAPPGTVALVAVALGAVGFDIFSGTAWWARRVDGYAGWALTARNSVALLAAIAALALAYRLAIWFTARLARGAPSEAALSLAFVPALIPVLFAFTVAHDLFNFLIQVQNAVVSASDPFGRGWDLFGTIDHAVDLQLLSPRAIADVQVAVILAGNVAAVVFVHDRSLEVIAPRDALRSQYPSLAAMIVIAVGGTMLLLGG